jgi:hypothetical protein
MKKQLMFLFSLFLCISGFAQQPKEVWQDLSSKINTTICSSPTEFLKFAKKPDADCINYVLPLLITDRSYQGDELYYCTFILPDGIKATDFEDAILSGNLFVSTCRTIAQVNIVNREANMAYGKKLIVSVTIDK